MKPYYYLAGKMSGMPDHNFPAFERISWELREAGFNVMSPHEINGGAEKKAAALTSISAEIAFRRECMQNDLAVLIRCDGIIMMWGWEHSRGARDEFDCALRLGHEILFLDREGKLI